MYKMYENLFDGLMEDLNPVFDGLNKAITKAPEACAVTSPMNVFKEEDGSYGVEVAVVGKTKEDIKLSARTENGKTFLFVESVEKEQSEDEKAAEQKRVYSVKKIKSGKINLQIGLPTTLDFTKLSAKVENGLLKISIPVSEAMKPLTFDIA